MRGNLFIKVFLGFWLISIAVLASWSLAVRYFEDVPEEVSEQQGPPPRYMLRLFYALENEPLGQLPNIGLRHRFPRSDAGRWCGRTRGISSPTPSTGGDMSS